MRASSAAPYFFDDFLTADSKRFQDGATTANNPTVIALQQARLLHPQVGSSILHHGDLPHAIDLMAGSLTVRVTC